MGKVRKFFTYSTDYSQNQKFERLQEKNSNIHHNFDKKIDLKLIKIYHYFCFRGRLRD